MNNSLDDNIHLRLPIKVTHQALESFLREKLIGESIKTEDNGKSSTYASILDVSLYRSDNQNFHFTLALTVKALTALFRNKEARLLMDVTIDFHRNEQAVLVKNFNLQVKTSNWLLENSLETIANTLLHGKLKNKMKYDFRPLLTQQLQKLNKKLEDSLEASDGIFLSGFLSDFEIVEILPGENLLLVIVEIEAKAILEVKNIKISP